MSPDNTVKQSDIETITWHANADLTGTVSHQLRVRPRGTRGEFIVLPSRITDPVDGIVESDYQGELKVGEYEVELKTIRADGDEITYPNGHGGAPRFARLDVIEDVR